MMNYSRLCHVGTVYALMVYLFGTDDTNLKKTYYLLGHYLDPDFVNRLPHAYRFKQYKGHILLSTIQMFLTKWLRLPKINKGVQYFVQDHIQTASIIVKNHEYTLVEDCAQICSIYENGKLKKDFSLQRQSRLYPILKHILGKSYLNPIGDNELCTTLLLSENDMASYIKNKNKIIVPITKENWDSFSVYKKNFILRVFDLSEKDIETLSKGEYILLTQPFSTDNVLTETEHFNLYKQILNHYSERKVIIKTHPRDEFPYQKYFPNCILFNKKIPFQLLCILGTSFNTAITVSSTAITMVSNHVSIDWYGTQCNHKLYNQYGDFPIPPSVANRVSIKKL